MKHSFILCLILIFANNARAQNDSINPEHPLPISTSAYLMTDTTKPADPHRYKIRPWVDIPYTIVADAYALWGMSVIYGRDTTPRSEILALNPNNVNSFDRPVTKNYSEKAKNASDKFFYGSMPLPLLMLIDKKIRKDGLRVGLLYLEAMGTTGVFYTTAAMLASRYRPYAYNNSLDIGTRQRGGAKNSFYAGHVALVGTSTFFISKVLSDYHPEWGAKKWIFYTLAAGATATTAYLRVRAGQHFKSDVLVGAIMGPTVGILVPHIHKNKDFSGNRLSLSPRMGLDGSTGFTAVFRLGRNL
jgi:membrane-associated phospholipid phosphatase